MAERMSALNCWTCRSLRTVLALALVLLAVALLVIPRAAGLGGLSERGSLTAATTPAATASHAYDRVIQQLPALLGAFRMPSREGTSLVNQRSRKIGQLRPALPTVFAAEAVRPAVSDARLGRALLDDFRGGPNPIGDGSALDAARHTIRTGDLVGGSTHLGKTVEMRDRYARVLRRGGLSPADERSRGPATTPTRRSLLSLTSTQ